MAGLTLDYRDDAVLAALQAIVDALGDPAPMLRDMGEYLLIAQGKRFASQTAPDGTPWQPLSPSYQRRKKKNKDKILQLDGYLKNLMRYQVKGSELQFGSDRLYAAILHFGGDINIAARSQHAYFRQDKSGEVGNRFVGKRKSNFAQRVTIGAYTIHIPARPIVGTSTEDDTELGNIALRYLEKASLRTGA